MIPTLRKRLIAVAMLSLFLVLTVIIFTVNFLNFQSIVSDADGILETLSQNHGEFPPHAHPPQSDTSKPPVMHAFPKPDPSPELPFESRFFSVRFDADGDSPKVNVEHVAAIDEKSAIKLAKSALSSAHKSGFVEHYRYKILSNNDGHWLIFLDCHRGLSTFTTFLWVSIGISLVGLAAVFLLLLVLSGRIVRPMSESYEKQKQFITNAGHEIKTPLAIIEADAELLELETGDNEWLQDIRLQTKRLATLTGDLIYLSRLEERETPLHYLSFSLSNLVTETAQSFGSLAETKGKTFSVNVQPSVSFTGDEKAIRQLVSILLDNAVKYSTDHGEIRLDLRTHGKNVLLCVANTADPSAMANCDRFFDRFYRGDHAETAGYGIGLSVAKAVVSAHKGKISACAVKDGLISFSVSLPVS